MVMRQTPDNGGGTIEFDGAVIRQDGLFTVAELDGLNPDNLK
jgi:aminopeptidase